MLLWLWCQPFWGSWEYHYRLKRLSQILLLSITVKNGWLTEHFQRITIKTAEVSQKKEQ